MSFIIARRVVEWFHGASEPSSAKESLSPREAQVLESIARGKRIKEVASELGVSVTTVRDLPLPRL